MRDPWTPGSGVSRPPMRVFPRNPSDVERKWQEKKFDLLAQRIWGAAPVPKRKPTVLTSAPRKSWWRRLWEWIKT